MTNSELLKMESRVTNLYYKNKCLFCLLLVINLYSYKVQRKEKLVFVFIQLRFNFYEDSNKLISESNKFQNSV